MSRTWFIPSSISRCLTPRKEIAGRGSSSAWRRCGRATRSSTQAVHELPPGPVNVPIAEKFPLPDKLTTYNSMEGLIQHFELIMPNRGVETPRDEVYAAIESPNGELGYYLVADGSQTGLARPDPTAVVHPFFGFPPHHQGLYARGRGGRAGQLEYHRRRVGSVNVPVVRCPVFLGTD